MMAAAMHQSHLIDRLPKVRGRLTADGRGAELWAVTPEGTVAMSARADLT